MATSEEKEPVGIRSVRNALAIIRYLNALQEPAGVNSIAVELGINVSSCFRLLKTLAAEGMLNFDQKSKTYTPAAGLVELARSALQRPEILILREEILELAHKYDTTAMVMFPAGRERAIITDVVERDSPLRLKIDVGQEFPIFVGAFGRCFAAHSGMTKKELRDHFESIEWDNAPPFDKYFRQVEQAKKDGYAIDHEDHLQGVLKVSACVRGSDGRPRFALSIVALAAKFSKKECRQIGLDLKGRAGTLESNAAFRSVVGVGG